MRCKGGQLERPSSIDVKHLQKCFCVHGMPVIKRNLSTTNDGTFQMPSSASISPFKTPCPFLYSFLVISVEFHRKRMKNKFCYALQRAGHSQNEPLWAWLQRGVDSGSAPNPLLRHYPRLLNVASELESHHCNRSIAI